MGCWKFIASWSRIELLLLFPATVFAWECTKDSLTFECSRPIKGAQWIGKVSITVNDGFTPFVYNSYDPVPFGANLATLKANSDAFIGQVAPTYKPSPDVYQICGGFLDPFSGFTETLQPPGNQTVSQWLRRADANYRWSNSVTWCTNAQGLNLSPVVVSPFAGTYSGYYFGFRTDTCPRSGLYWSDWDYSSLNPPAESTDYAICYYWKEQPCTKQCGNQVTASGVKAQAEIDWSSSSSPLVVRRYYTSRPMPDRGSATSTPIGLLNPTWMFSYQNYLGFSAGQVTANLESGRRISFSGVADAEG